MLTLKEMYLWLKGLSNPKRCCYGKQKCSKKSAIHAKSAMENKTGRLFDVYWCPWCRKWHIGGTVKGKELCIYIV